MTTPEIDTEKDNVIEAVKLLLEKDLDLLDLSAHEQSICHRMGVYLECIAEREGLNVDCEYNKHLDDMKSVNLFDFLSQSFNGCGCDSCRKIESKQTDQIDKKQFRPDIVIHSRGNDFNNLLVIEVKKENKCPFDFIKLQALTKPKEKNGEYGYKLGAFICFPGNKPEYTWFVNGIETK